MPMGTSCTRSQNRGLTGRPACNSRLWERPFVLPLRLAMVTPLSLRKSVAIICTLKGHVLGSDAACPHPLWRSPRDLVNGAVGERDHKQVAVGTGHDVRANPKPCAKQQAFALREVELIEVIGHAVG